MPCTRCQLDLHSRAWDPEHCQLHEAAPKLLHALKVLLTNHELGEAESQKRGLPRLIEARETARNAIHLAEKEV
jgi:hypothetical protein